MTIPVTKNPGYIILIIMKDKTINKYPEISNQCFWDLDYKKLDLIDDRNFIIERVVSRGGSNDEVELLKFYGWETVKKEVVKIRYLNRKILNYLSLLFDISKDNFRAHKNEDVF